MRFVAISKKEKSNALSILIADNYLFIVGREKKIADEIFSRLENRPVQHLFIISTVHTKIKNKK